MKTITLSAAIAACLLSATPLSATAADIADGSSSTSFYNRKSEGWFWYEPEPEPKPELKPEPKPLKPELNISSQNSKSSDIKKEPKEVEVNVAWLRQNLPKLRDAAIDNPTYENVRRYFYTQRVMMDKASKFASVSTEVSKFETALDETLRRPDNQIAVNVSKIDAKTNRKHVFNNLSKKAGFFFLYSSNCSYCLQQAPLLANLQRDTGIDVLAVSLDGKPLPNGLFPDYVTDPGTLRERLKVMVTPTIYLVKKDGSEFHNVAAGLTSIDELMRRSVMLANKQGWITDKEYNTTKEVKEILLADDTKGKLMVDQEQLYNDPNYLADKLRLKFQQNYGKLPQTSTSMASQQ